MYLLRILAYPSQNIITDMRISSYFRKYVFLPPDHGPWVFILGPLLIGIFAGGRFNLAASLALGLASVYRTLSSEHTWYNIISSLTRKYKWESPAACLTSLKHR